MQTHLAHPKVSGVIVAEMILKKARMNNVLDMQEESNKLLSCKD
jgi:hypothetical protein